MIKEAKPAVKPVARAKSLPKPVPRKKEEEQPVTTTDTVPTEREQITPEKPAPSGQSATVANGYFGALPQCRHQTYVGIHT